MADRKRSPVIKPILYSVLTLLTIVGVWTAVVAYQQSKVWTSEAQAIEDEFKVHALDYLNTYNKDNPDNTIQVTNNIIGTYNQNLDTLNEWMAFDEFDPQLFTLAAKRMPYVSQYNTDLNESFVGNVRKLFGVEEREFITMMLSHEH